MQGQGSAAWAVALCVLLSIKAGRAEDRIGVVSRPDTSMRSPFYPGNREPLRPSALVKLPVGAVRPQGWLKQQLQLQSDGFHGHLTEISRFLRKDNNSWLNPQGLGEYGWEEVPYWLKGFGDCAYLLNRQDQIDEARIWIEGAMRSQSEDGFFGPRGQGAKATVASTQGKYDLWPNMVMLNVFQSYYEYSGDERILDLMSRYFRFELGIPEEEFLPPYWQQQRGADNLASVYWLYNRTGEPWLLELAAKIHRRTANYTEGVNNWHNVNLAQAFGGPATFWAQSGDERHLKAAYRNYDEIRRQFGQVPGGLWGGDENSRPGFTDPRQAIETCGMVEFMLSAERLTSITGDPLWADRCEDVAFNMLPAALTEDMKALRYLTAPNQVVSDRMSHSPGIQNGGPMFCMDPNDHRCCQHNFGHGWPYLAEHLWMASNDRGLALIFPLASTVRAKVGTADGTVICWEAVSRYPFEPSLELHLRSPTPVDFPLYIRIPGWCHSASLEINGKNVPVDSRPLSYLRIERTWSDGDRVRVEFPMKVTLRTWEANHRSVSVDRGPLTYSLLIGEKYVRSGGTDAWPAYEIHPTSPWNYALELDAAEPTQSFEVMTRPWPEDDRPWSTQRVPTLLRAKGRKVPEWRIDPYGLVAPLQESPVATTEPIETIELIPMGAARLRISAFPVVGRGPEAHRWTTPPDPLPYAVSASHCFESDTLRALLDRIVPASSSDREVARMTWWPRQGSSEWVAYDFGGVKKVQRVGFYWFDDMRFGGGCALPESWQLLYLRAGQWHPVPGAGPAEPVANQLQEVTFPPIEAEGLRLIVQLQPGRSAGLLEWEVD